MATMDIFNNSAFRTREMGEAINVVPNMYGRVGELGIFTPKPLRQTQFQIESQNGRLVLVQSSERGERSQGSTRGKRNLRDFHTRHFEQERRIKADDIAGIRAHGSETELKQAQDEVNDRLIDIRSNLDITREYLRCGALQGLVKDADGSTIVDLHAEFGVTKKSVDFVFGTSGNKDSFARQVLNHIQRNLKGDMMNGVRALCSEGFFDKLMLDDDFKDSYKFFMSADNPLRDDVRKGVYWQGIMWEQYLGEADVPQEDGTLLSTPFIPANEAVFFPEGTRQTFRDFNAPADFMETVNQPGKPFYSKVAVDPKYNSYADVLGTADMLPMCLRPAVLVRGHSST